MKIGNIDFGSRPLFLAPMEDVTDIGFRKLCKRYGAAMVYTEFRLRRRYNTFYSKHFIKDEGR